MPSFGKTDETGKYSLTYRNGVPGAPPGKYIVSITTFSEGDPDADPPEPKSPEKVPARYNQETELTEEVTPGENTINFDLEGGGNILEPPDPNAMDDG